ncbi:MAG: hypothetical protein V4507_09975 [Verrucomicrobiota bacterium]
MIPLIAGIAAAGPIASMFSKVTQSITQPSPVNPAQFNQSMQTAAAQKPEQIQLNALLQGRVPAQLSPQEQQQLSNLLVGKTVQMTGMGGEQIQGIISQAQNNGTGIQLGIQGQNIDLNQVASIQIS